MAFDDDAIVGLKDLDKFLKLLGFVLVIKSRGEEKALLSGFGRAAFFAIEAEVVYRESLAVAREEG